MSAFFPSHMRLRKNLHFSLSNIKSSIFALAVFLLGACHYEDRDFDQIPIDAPAEVKEVFREFYDRAQELGVEIKWKQLTVKYISNTSTVSGTSYTHNSILKNYIEINTANEVYKKGFKALLFHELGHYYLNRDHEEDWDERWPFYNSPITNEWKPMYLPPSIMTPGYIIPDEFTKNELWGFYTSELFSVTPLGVCSNKISDYMRTVGP